MATALAGEIPVLGEFELRREIGRGGMGTVYEAWQRSLQRTVAIKILASHVGLSDKAITRFQREAQAAAKLHHVNIVQIFAQGEIDGIYYYAMELVDGHGINHIIAAHQRELGIEPASELAETVALSRDSQTGLPIGPAVKRPAMEAPAVRSGVTMRVPKHGTGEFFRFVAEQMAAVADALDYAHARGIVHRDIKPHNLLLGSDGRIQVSDFGLARLSEQPGVTMTGELVGSPLYMSPEQITGDFAAVDHRTDIYSLGATMYEWLTLQPPYPGETRERVIGRILSSEAVPPRQQNEEIPVDLETIAMKAIERDPDRRYQQASEFRDDLRRFLGRRPVLARRAGVAFRTAKFVRRHQVATVAAAAIVLATTLLWSLWVNRLKSETQMQQASALEQATAEAAQAKKDKEKLLTDLMGLMKADPELIRKAAPMIGDAVAMTTDATRSLGGPAIGTSLSIAANLPHGLLSSILTPDSLLADRAAAALAAWRKGDLPEAKRLVDQYLVEHPADWNAVQLRAAVSAGLQQYEDLLRDAQRLVETPDHKAIGLVWRGLAQLMGNQVPSSIGGLSEAVELLRSGGDQAESNPHLNWARVARGLAYLQRGSTIDAIRDFDDVIKDAPEFLPAHLGLASLLFSSEDYEGAKDRATHVIERDAKNADALTIRGDCYAALGNPAAATEDYKRAMEISGYTWTLAVKLTQVNPPGLPSSPTQPPAHVPVEPKVLLPQQEGSALPPSKPEPVSDSGSGKPHLESPRPGFDASRLQDVRFRIP